MTMQAEIDAVVQAFVEDLADMVRRTALAAVQSALDGEEAWSPPPPAAQARAKAPSAPAKPASKASKPKPAAPKPVAPKAPARAAARSAPKPAREAPMDVDAETEATEEPKAAPAPAPPLRKRLDPQRRGRVIVVPSTPPASMTTEETSRSAHVKGESSSASSASSASVAEPPVEVAEVTPAKKWVIMRRPARDRSAGASEPPPPNGQKPSEPAAQSAPVTTAEAPKAPEPAPVESARVESAPVIERVTELDPSSVEPLEQAEPLASQDDEIAAG